MADFSFSSADLESLGQKLDGLADLTERDRALLLAVFRLAADHVDSASEVQGFASPEPPGGLPFQARIEGSGSDLPPLAAGLRDSFRPGVASRPGGRNIIAVLIGLNR